MVTWKKLNPFILRCSDSISKTVKFLCI
ncbi:protein of unknown function [Nitrospina watsonii]|uniref:Uncharacterized protein n=1 Tax=Nitrospina watsonii TaxID=1323948 RepID=A0ABM9HDT9_9BACT|nr:protein of unknown function [Nitrospina watsonii]